MLLKITNNPDLIDFLLVFTLIIIIILVSHSYKVSEK